ncbi:hypothetical protein [Anaerovorax odorimutans]|uniref:hypothetical protein n=1 Tax=Anaerovorax odorimutans TaxID=109327 RepID=UPI00042827C8|nr:hypothetical protein [Anaerovorax odorimutans]
MMLAEKNYEYQRVRRPYSVDAVERKRQVKSSKKKSNSIITSKDKIAILMFTLFVGIICVGLILCTAYAAKVKYNINNLTNKNEVIAGEIETLNVEIQSASNIKTIEEKAISRIGMIHPTQDQLVFMDGNKKPADDFSLALKQQAYN